MYTLLRNTHLGAGLFASIVLVAYALSALQMAFPLYRPEPTISEWTIDAIPDLVAGSPRDLARWLMDEHGLRGELTEATPGAGTIGLSIGRPGTSYDVEYAAATRTAHVTTTVDNAVAMLSALHQVSGVAHEDGGTRAWGWLLLSGSVALLLLAATGVVMWFKRHDDRFVGALVLGAGLAWGLTLLILVRTA